MTTTMMIVAAPMMASTITTATTAPITVVRLMPVALGGSVGTVGGGPVV